MMGVGAKRALGLYRSCAPRQTTARYLKVDIRDLKEVFARAHPRQKHAKQRQRAKKTRLR